MTNLQLFALVIVIASIGAPVSLAQEGANSVDSMPFDAADDAASPRIARLRADIAMLGASAVDEFWVELDGIGAPIIESIPSKFGHSLVTFVWRGSEAARNVVITDGVSVGNGGADPLNSLMTHITGTDVWYRSYEVRNDGRFTYALSENDPLALFTDPARMSNSMADPLNRNRLPIIGQTYVALPDAPIHAWTDSVAPEDSGEVFRLEWNDRDLRVYTPAGFSTARDPYPLLVTMGGGFYGDMLQITTILDQLIAAGHIPPMVAVMVSSGSGELQCSPAFSRYLAEELAPWAMANYHAATQPELTVIAGASLGGLASSCAAVSHPDVFGKVLSQSGSYWWNREYRSREEGDDFSDAEWLTRQIEAVDRVPVDFYIEVGLMEFEGQLDTNRRFRDALLAKGYSVEYQEFNGNHSYVNWRESFGAALVILMRE